MKILFDTQTSSFVRYPREDDQPVIGLDPRYKVYALVFQPEPEYDPSTHFLTSEDVPDHTAKILTRNWTVTPLTQTPPDNDPGGNGVPLSISPRQLRLWLLNHSNQSGDLLSQAIGLVNAPTDPVVKRQQQLQWEYATIIERSHPMTISLATGLGLNSAALDQAFIEASTIP